MNMDKIKCSDDVVIANYDEQFKKWRDDEGRTHNITYWMPLPEPPVKY
jgi:hypothetical protein